MENKIRELIKQAMLSKNKNMQITYKSILENAQKIAKKDIRNVCDDDIIRAAKNEIKQLNDLFEYCKNDELRSAEICEKIKYCQNILPAQISDKDVLIYLEQNNLEKNIGVCMKALKNHFGSSLDGKSANIVVKKYCGKD